MNKFFAERIERVKPSAIRQLLKFGADPDIISFGGGYPDANMFPIKELNNIYTSLLSGPADTALQYTHSAGIPRLREQVAERMNADGVVCTQENILILQGGQQGLDLVAKLLIDKGDIIVTEAPTFLGALIAFNPYQPEYLSIPMDENGLMTDALEGCLKKQGKIKFLYTVPDFHNPTGITLSLERRKKLIALANEYDFIILEDTPYREIRYQGEKLPTIKSMDTEGRVIYLGSFSKTLAPGLRVGWSVASPLLTEKLGLLKLAADTQCSTLNMSAVSLYLDTYDIDKHIENVRRVYLRKKELMLNTIAETFPDNVRFTNPSGGMFTWMEFPAGFNTEAFLMEKAVPLAQVAYVPGGSFFATKQQKNYARLSYSTHTDTNIVKGISSLGALLKSVL
ncbi:aminotransferase-like domain-containing protein [Brenneria tiliae]|uniref:aminotransferase-like domain-containing protein n=1 Tax=Brenneria tiliae TaxID=2914984 RepID=UPI002014FC41|nr:PLP-dependent aminotransferase family protein [Brenneria tiliae]MCL2896107.1 PLP-dependent aminotransferase family protein [Brenneria tiliae]MCL2900698.1 PLP-dependent aminotransferase family protein [Brenneria tiliae]